MADATTFENLATGPPQGLRIPISGVPWYHLDDPQSPALDDLAHRFGLHELDIEDCRHRPQRAKTEEHGNYMFTVFKRLRRSEDEFSFEDFDVFLGEGYLITVHPGECCVLDDVHKRATLDATARVDKLMYYLADAIVDEYVESMDEISDHIAEIEDDVLANPDPEVLSRIFAIKRKLTNFRRIAGGMREVVNAIMRREKGLCGDDLDPYFRDVYDHLVRTADLVDSYRDILGGSLDIYLSAVANRTNETMKRLTLFGTIATPLVIITGFFGMNLHLPLQEYKHGFAAVVAIMAISTLAVLGYFRWKDWI